MFEFVGVLQMGMATLGGVVMLLHAFNLLGQIAHTSVRNTEAIKCQTELLSETVTYFGAINNNTRRTAEALDGVNVSRG